MNLADSVLISNATASGIPRPLYYFLTVYFGLVALLWLIRRFLPLGAVSKRQHDWWLPLFTGRTAEMASDETGLTSAEARARLAEFGPNLFDVRQRQPLVLQFFRGLRIPWSFCCSSPALFRPSWGRSPNFTIRIVLFSVTLDFVQEHRAGKAAERLRQFSIGTR